MSLREAQHLRLQVRHPLYVFQNSTTVLANYVRIVQPQAASSPMVNDSFWPIAACHEKLQSARSGQFHRLSSSSLKLEGVYSSRGRFSATLFLPHMGLEFRSSSHPVMDCFAASWQFDSADVDKKSPVGASILC